MQRTVGELSGQVVAAARPFFEVGNLEIGCQLLPGMLLNDGLRQRTFIRYGSKADGAVPHRMEVIRRPPELKGISSPVALRRRMLRGDVGDALHRLVDVANQVDQPA